MKNNQPPQIEVDCPVCRKPYRFPLVNSAVIHTPPFECSGCRKIIALNKCDGEFTLTLQFGNYSACPNGNCEE